MKIILLILTLLFSYGSEAQAFLPTIAFKTGKLYIETKVSEESSISIPLRLDQPSSEVVTVDFVTSGTAADENTPTYGTSNVCGPNYSLSSNRITFNPGEIYKDATLSIKARKSPDGDPIVSDDLYLKITLANPKNARLFTGNAITIKLIDNRRKLLVNVKQPETYGQPAGTGAKGDGISDDTKAIQNAINYVKNYINNSKEQGVVFFPPGTFIISYNLKWHAGVALIGQSRNQVTIKRFSEAQMVASGVTPDTQGRYWAKMMGNTEYANSLDSALTCLRKITFDGNNAGCPWTPTTYTKWEPSQMFFLSNKSSAYAGRLKVLVEDCQFKEGPSSGISNGDNCYTQVYNSNFNNINRYKSGYVSVGGNATSIIKQCIFDGDKNPCGFDIETNGNNLGYYLDSRLKFIVEDTKINGCFDFGHKSLGHSEITLRRTTNNPNINTPATFDATISDTELYFFDCDLKFGRGNKIWKAKKVYAQDCTFTLINQSTGLPSCFPMMLTSDASQPSFEAELINCTFQKAPDVTDNTYGVYTVIYNSPNHSVSVRDSNFIDTYYGVSNFGFSGLPSSVAGKIIIENCNFTNATYLYYLSGYGVSDKVLDISMTTTKSIFTNCQNYAYIHGYNSATQGQYINIEHIGPIPLAMNKITSKLGIRGNKMGVNPQRLLSGSGVPAGGINAFVNDKYTDTNNGNIYNCIQAGYYVGTIRYDSLWSLVTR